MLFVPEGKTPEDYEDWAKQIGQASSIGVALAAVISYSSDNKPDVGVQGVVGVPRPPEDDLERMALTGKLYEMVEASTLR